METLKIRVKIGANEFEAEGPKDEVSAQFAAWKVLVAKAPEPEAAKPASVQGADPAAEGATPGLDDVLKRAYATTRENLVTLSAHPTGENKGADAILLLLLGYLGIAGIEDVPVTKLKESLRLSGLNVDRIDRAVDGYRANGLVLKSGRGKGNKYRLSTTGMAKARAMVKALLEGS